MPPKLLLLPFLALAAATSMAAREDPLAGVGEIADPILTIRIYNYADVAVETLREATAIGWELFLRSGVVTRWVVCELPGYDFAADGPCANAARPNSLCMRLAANPPDAGRSGIDDLVYGFALPSQDRFGSVASVFWDRIAASAELSKVTRAQLLGVAMAHEVGHLLLGSNSHSGRGLMSGVWDEAQFTRISQGGLAFIGSQRKRIRAAAAARAAEVLRQAARPQRARGRPSAGNRGRRSGR